MKTVGILGGGQLSRMLAQAALKLGFNVHVYGNTPEDPAARVPGVFFRAASLENGESLRAFLSPLDAVAFENEFLDIPTLKKASQGLTTFFAPELSVFERVQDKLAQKEIFKNLNFPTAPFLIYSEKEKPENWLKTCHERFPEGFVLKWSRQGYDGKGVLGCGTGFEEKNARFFVHEGLSRGARIYAEEKIFFRKELAVVACASSTGAFAAYPLVLSKQTPQNICLLVQGPAPALGVSAALENQAHDFARKLAKTLPLRGTFALELFETPGGDLLINELAPRVHNSGHYTLDAAETSQFENHWRAVAGLPLGSTQTTPFFAMFNLLGPSGVTANHPPSPPDIPEAVLHWYEKTEIRPNRKMGHFNLTAQAQDELEKKLEKVFTVVEHWEEHLRKKTQENHRREIV